MPSILPASLRAPRSVVDRSTTSVPPPPPSRTGENRFGDGFDDRPLPTGGAVTLTGRVTEPSAVKDRSSVESVMRIDDDLAIETLALDLDLEHSWRGDLRVTLVSPKGTRAVLSDREGGSADDLKLKGFDLSAFKGESTKGNWTLHVQDAARGDEGTLTAWSLTVEGHPQGDFPVDPEPTPEPVPSERDPRFAGLRDDALWTRIGQVAGTKSTVSYSAARKLIFTDIDNHDGLVKCVYTQRVIRTNKIPDNRDMNVEHTWPQSLGATGTAKSDLHHLFPTDSKANGVRGNHPFGEVERVKWSDPSGLSRAGADASGRHVFEPPAEHRGDVARAMFYFSSVYKKHIDPKQEAVLKKWNLEDPPDAAEIARNDAVERIQRNRNPFIDDPTLANDIQDF